MNNIFLIVNKYFLERRERLLNNDCIPEELLIEEDNESSAVDDNFPNIIFTDDKFIDIPDTKGLMINTT